MSPLTVLYDAGCPFCRRCREWVEGQPTLVGVAFVPLDSSAARALWGGRVPGNGRDLVVVDATGAYWVGSDAFIVVLWALDGYRSAASFLGWPPLRPFAALFFGFVSEARPLLSSLFGSGETCEGTHCGVAHRGVAPHEGAYR